MAEEKILTPSYWNDPFFQPIVQTKTLYGNPVKIPKRFVDYWEKSKAMLMETLKSEQEQADFSKYMKEGLESMITNRGWQAEDFARVMLEIYEERDCKPPIPRVGN